ncbi:hypothetical protein LXA43DRAFT_1009943 [Ganoderma leucocontextum]|nr:hypothetical protein LXA43DRAFT_1009943 [Ganoderma leucocontextum]
MPPLARCEDCKQEFPSRKAAREHATTAGHTGGAGYFCRECGENLGKLKRYKAHINGTGHTQQRMPCAECPLQFTSTLELSTHRRTAHFKPGPLVKRCARCGHEIPIGEVHLQCLDNSISCPICHLRFANGGELTQHVTNVSPCVSCSLCLRPSETLADHLWTSEMHPKCLPCKLGFDKIVDLDQHKLSCPSLTPAESPAPSDVLPSTTESIGNTRVDTPFVVLDARPSPQHLQNDVPLSDAGTPSWHCRSCLQEPCVDPIATICGHLFCRGCFMRELSAKTCCPVCGKIFFVRLDVAG